MNFLNKIITHAIHSPKKIAVVIDDFEYSYQYLLNNAFLLSSYFEKYSHKNKPCIILSEKNNLFYASVLACFLSNAIYTPINILAPLDRNKKIINCVGNAFFYIGEMKEDVLLSLISDVSEKDFLISNKKLYEFLIKNNFNNRFHYIDDTGKTNIKRKLKHSNLNDIAYLLFTSGSTGMPKGVPISYTNIDAYLYAIHKTFSFHADDRFTQLSDIGFDISIHEMLVCWSSGAALYVYNENSAFNVAFFITKHNITQCILIPSMIPLIVKQCTYLNLHFKSLQLSIFCGEAFPVAYAKLWRTVASLSPIVNLYGPTEATVGCLYHIYNENRHYNDVLTLPIGHSLIGTQVDLTEHNEIMISGAQVAKNYWSSTDNNAKKFFFNPERKCMYYHSGDKAVFCMSDGFIFQGRLDDQWQVKGFRIEKSEIENILRSVFHVTEIYVSPHFMENQLVDFIMAFSTEKIDIKCYQKILMQLLPLPVIPKEVFQISEIPRLANGKINYHYFSELSNNL